MTETFDLAALACARWRRAVDLLAREAVRRRRDWLAEEERARADRRARNLRRIVRRALAEYSRVAQKSGGGRQEAGGGRQ